MRVLIVDDEAPARDRLKRHLEDLSDYQVLGEAENGKQALDVCNTDRPDIVLLDIRMPGLDGIETARYLSELDNPPAVIFTTAYNEYAIDAFDAQAIGYLMKPIRRSRLERALQHAARLSSPQLKAITETEPRRPRDHVCAKVRNQLQLIPLDEIYYFQSDQKYTRVKFSEGEVLIDDSLKALEQEFQERVLRVHRNTLVLRHELLALDKGQDGSYYARLRNSSDELSVSRRLVSSLRKAIKRG
ncbi:MAG: LytTR family DNA-binding domain-containing protein [Pseudomonadota bacterium]